MVITTDLILYHGSGSDFKRIDLQKAEPYKDFGRGFYLTTSLSQAMKWANRGFRKRGSQRKSYLYCYKLSVEIEPSSSDMNILELLSYDEKWLNFICQNRLQDSDSQYDIVYDRMADNLYQEISETVHAYNNHEIPLEEAIEKLRWKSNHGDQYCFKTKKAIELLVLHEKVDLTT